MVTKDGVETTTDFTYTGLTLRKLSATKTQGETSESWSITYLYDEYGKPYAGVYRDTTGVPANWPAPMVFGLVTTDRGDVVELLDANGDPFAAYRYDAWGNPLGTGTDGATGMWWQTTASITDANLAKTISERQVLRYAGYCYDSESGMYYLSARHYDPATRQFLSKDLSRNDGEQSAYQYCLGNPVKYVDPTGLHGQTRETFWGNLAASVWLKLFPSGAIEAIDLGKLTYDINRIMNGPRSPQYGAFTVDPSDPTMFLPSELADAMPVHVPTLDELNDYGGVWYEQQIRTEEALRLDGYAKPFGTRPYAVYGYLVGLNGGSGNMWVQGILTLSAP